MPTCNCSCIVCLPFHFCTTVLWINLNLKCLCKKSVGIPFPIPVPISVIRHCYRSCFPAAAAMDRIRNASRLHFLGSVSQSFFVIFPVFKNAFSQDETAICIWQMGTESKQKTKQKTLWNYAEFSLCQFICADNYRGEFCSLPKRYFIRANNYCVCATSEAHDGFTNIPLTAGSKLISFWVMWL